MRRLAIIFNLLLLSYLILYAGGYSSEESVWTMQGVLDYFTYGFSGEYYRDDPVFFFFDLFILFTPIITLYFLLTHQIVDLTEEDTDNISSRF
mgnify:FL=1